MIAPVAAAWPARFKLWRGVRAALRLSHATRHDEGSRGDALTGLEKRREKFPRPIDAGSMVAVHGVNRGARNRIGELPLSLWRDERIAFGHHDRRRNVHRADPLSRGELVNRP